MNYLEIMKFSVALHSNTAIQESHTTVHTIFMVIVFRELRFFLLKMA